MPNHCRTCEHQSEGTCRHPDNGPGTAPLCLIRTGDTAPCWCPLGLHERPRELSLVDVERAMLLEALEAHMAERVQGDQLAAWEALARKVRWTLPGCSP